MPEWQFSTYGPRDFKVSWGGMDSRKLNVISQVSMTSRQLRDLAEEAELPLLTYLLGMVTLEAEKALQDGNRSARALATRVAASLARN